MCVCVGVWLIYVFIDYVFDGDFGGVEFWFYEFIDEIVL